MSTNTNTAAPAYGEDSGALSATSSGIAATGKRRVEPQAVVVLLVAIALVVVGRVTTPEFVTSDNLLAILRAASITAIVALGLTFVTISGNYFSLSVAQTAVLASVLYAAVASSHAGVVLAVLVVLAACALVVVTLAAGAAIIAGVLYATDSKRVLLKVPGDSLAAEIGRAAPLGIPTATWAFVVVALVCVLLLDKTVLGRRTIMVGANRLAAVASGLNVTLVITATFVISAITAGIAGILTAAEFGVADSAQFTGLDIDAIAAVLVGGTSIRGGEGSVTRTCVGALFIATLRNLLQLRGYSTGIQLTFVGLAVVVAVCVYALMKRKER
jgi:ribose transport system permease protein